MAKDEKKNPDEKKKKASPGDEAATGSAAQDQPDKKDDSKEPDFVNGAPDLLNLLQGKDAQSILAKIEQIDEGITDKEDQNVFLKEWRKTSTSFDKRYGNNVGSPTPEQKKAVGLIIEANNAFIVAAKAQLDVERKKLADVVKKDSQKLANQMNDDKATSPYFLNKNKGHIRKKVVGILEDTKQNDRRCYRELKNLAAGRGVRQKKDFETKVLVLIKESDEKLHKKFTGTVKFKSEMLDYTREQLKTL